MFDQAHPRGVPHFYLTLVGTSVDHRGHAYGLRLLAENLRHVDEAGLPSYLEASNPANVPLYMRYGFEVLDSFTLHSAIYFLLPRGARHSSGHPWDRSTP